MCVSFQSVFRKYPQWTLESLPSGQRKKKRSNGLLFSLIGWPHSLWNLDLVSHDLVSHGSRSVLSSHQSHKDLALLRQDKEGIWASTWLKERGDKMAVLPQGFAGPVNSSSGCATAMSSCWRAVYHSVCCIYHFATLLFATRKLSKTSLLKFPFYKVFFVPYFIFMDSVLI